MNMKRLLVFGALFFAASSYTAIAQVKIIETIAGTSSAGFSGDGAQASAAQLNFNYMVSMDGTGNLYICDNTNNRIRRIDAISGNITTVAGTSGTGGYTTDGIQATASKLNGPVGVYVDPTSSFLLIGDNLNNRVRKVDLGTGIISTIAGGSTPGFSGDGFPATGAKLTGPRGVCADVFGNVYFADAGNNRIRMIDVSGNISTIAGNGTPSYVTDGVAGNTTPINNPRGVYADAGGNVYFADMNNSRIRKLDAGTFIIHTVAGTGTAGYSGDGASALGARINLPTDMTFDGAGNMYISDVSNNRIRMVDIAGKISTVAGSASTAGFAGDGGLATSATVKLNGPVSVAVSSDGSYFYISDRTNSRIRVVRNNTTPTFTGGSRLSLTVCRNSSATSINTLLAATDIDLAQTLTWSVNTAPLHGTLGVLPTTKPTTGAAVTPAGITYQPTIGYDGLDSFLVNVSDGFATSTVTVVVTVNPYAGNISGPTSVCVGASIALSDDVTGGAWSSLNTSIATVDASGNVTPVAGPGGPVTIAYTSSLCSFVATATYPITVLPLPSVAAITGGSASLCETGGSIPTITVSDATTGGVWNEQTGNSSISSSGVITGITAGTDIISYTVTNSCGPTTVTAPINILPLPHAGTITGDASFVCLAGTLSLSDATPGGVWSAAPGHTSVDAFGTVSGLTIGSDVVSYSLTNTCGTDVTTYPVNVVLTPTIGGITGPKTVCVAASISLSNATGGGTWTESTGNASVSSAGSVTGITAGTDIITYAVSFSCGSATATYAVTVNPLADPGTIVGATDVCMGASTMLTDAITGGVWSSSATTIASVSAGVVNGLATGSANISYSVTNVCGTVSTFHAVSVNAVVTPAVTITASPGFSSCAGNPVTYTAIAVFGGSSPTFQWKVNGAVLSSGATFAYTPVNGDTISVTLTSSAPCVSTTTGTSSKVVKVTPVLVPGVTISSGVYGDTVCTGLTPVFTPTAVNGGSTPVYDWYINSVLVFTGPTFSHTMVAPTDNGDIVSCVMSSSYACPSAASVTSNTITMTVDDLFTEVPKLSVTANPGSAVCASTPVTFVASTTYGGISPLVRWTKNGINVATGYTYTYVPGNGDMVHCMLRSSSGCLVSPVYDSIFTSDMVMSVLTEKQPRVTVSAAAGTTVGAGDNLLLTATVTNPTTSMTYQWLVNGVAVPGATTNVYSFSQADAGTSIVNCIVTSGDVCNYTSISNLLNLTITGLGVAQTGNSENNIRLMPNPTRGALMVEGTMSSTINEVTMQIVDIVGQVVYNGVATVQNGILNAHIVLDDQLANGVYLLHVTAGNEHSVSRFSVNR